MHWTLGKRRTQTALPADEAARTAGAVRAAAAVGLVSAVLAVCGAYGAEVLDDDFPRGAGCTALALSGYTYLYEDGVISQQEYEELRRDALDDELNNTGACATSAQQTGPPTGTQGTG